jgi:hypothetical protein
VIRATLDPRLAIRVITRRALRYDAATSVLEDRPPHVRAASGLAFAGERLVVIQDDASFIAFVAHPSVSAGHGATAIPLPRGAGGRRRFEVALGNKREKLDLEACLAVDGELWAFGSGSTRARDKICRMRDGVPRLLDAAPLYARVREAIGALNLEGVARAGAELWLFHRGNTGPDDPGPAVARLSFEAVRAWLDDPGVLPSVLRCDRYDLGAIGSVRLGFTDAATVGDRTFYLAVAEASRDAIDDGSLLGSQLGVICGDEVRAAALTERDGTPLKAEGLAIDPTRQNHAFITIDPDDVEQPALLYEIELVGPW